MNYTRIFNSSFHFNRKIPPPDNKRKRP